MIGRCTTVEARWATTLAGLAIIAAGSLPATAGGAPPLTQLPGTAGCISETGTGGDCFDGHHLDNPRGLAVSPDGRNVYVASNVSSALLIFTRDPDTGGLTANTFATGCVAAIGTLFVCAEGDALEGAHDVVVSPDGRHVYVASSSASALAVFDRDAATGSVLQKAGTDGCISDSGTEGACVDGVAMAAAVGVAISPDGRSVYVAALGADAVTVFDRDPATGELTQKVGTDGCISETGGACADGRALDGPVDIVVSRDGMSVYVASMNSDAIAIFDRDAATGELTQKGGLAGCISETGTGGTCADGRALDSVRSVVVNADGRNAYATAELSDAPS